LGFCLLGLALSGTLACQAPTTDQSEDAPYKVYVMLGFHASFYHSWRGDTPDEAGFGTDIRLVREIIRMLDQANAQGLQARGYWDFDVYWTLEQIIPAHAPEIIEDIRRRVQSGQDEVLPGPYNNGANHAATEEEFRMALAYALENPHGSGLKQLFGQVTPIYRPQETMYTAGQNAILAEEGFDGFVLYYSSVPFDSVSPFIPTLPPEQRYNPLWFRSSPHERPVIILPAVSPMDLFNYVSLEKWLLDLRQLQTSGQVKSDLVLHLNFDADVETWLPLDLPRAFAWFPNTGGLMEYVQAVNKYPWAEFTVPSEYLKTHPPRGEILVRQDLADGAFNGNYSWAEKFGSLQNWTALEQSRLHSYRATALAQRLPEPLATDLDRRLWQGTDSSFFQRLIGLSTTHFGMSTPVINEERQAKAEMVIGRARQIAADAERDAAQAVRTQAKVSEDALYAFEVYNYARGKQAAPQAAQMLVRVPVVLPPGVEGVATTDADGKHVPASLVDLKPLWDGSAAGELLFVANLGPGERQTYRVDAVAAATEPRAGPVSVLQNRWLDLGLSESSGIVWLKFEGQEIGGDDFLQPFITYSTDFRSLRDFGSLITYRSTRFPKTWLPSGYTFDDLSTESWDGLARARLRAQIPMDTPDGRYTSQLSYTFTLFDDLPYLLVDVEADYAYTPPRDLIQTVQQKLRRLLDLRWIEVAPFQLHPAITAPATSPLRVWKHNYLGVTSYYDLNYGQINPRNKNLDSFNHQVTAGWVAVSNGQRGLLIAESAEALASLAFCPMRLRETDGVQHLSLNPFGSYYGQQLDYSHLGGTGVGTELTIAGSSAMRPNGPSFNGQTERFSLLLAPYAGDQPPPALQTDAAAFFYPFGVIYLKTPPGMEAVVPDDVRRLIADKEREARLMSTAPLPPPTAFLANPSDGAVDLVWDSPRDERVTGYEVRWRKAEAGQWQTERIAPATRWHLPDLENGERYMFQIRALGEGRQSEWTEEAECVPGPLKPASLLSAASGASPWTLLRLIYYGLLHGLTLLRGHLCG
jgi:hypothetical protein